jgi:hypothetical protein
MWYTILRFYDSGCMQNWPNKDGRGVDHVFFSGTEPEGTGSV